MTFTGKWLPTLALLLLAPLAWAADYSHYQLGDPAAPTPDPVRPGLLLMGGGDRNHDALRWFFERAGHGHIVVLRASQANEVAEEFFTEIGGIASVETYVVANREASNDRALLRKLSRADGIFIAGGDQSRYIRYWRGTPVAKALDDHVSAGKPIGGTSAGLAMLGEYFYGAMDGGSQVSPRALADPLGEENTVETGFLGLTLLHGVLTDTHFRERNRLGRLVSFVAKAESMAGPQRRIIGLGVDEDAALAVEADGRTRVFATAPGAGATVVPGGFARVQREDEPMQLQRFEVIGVGTDSVLHLPEGRVDSPSFRRSYAVRDGVMVALNAPLLLIHGGAGVERAGLSPEEETEARAALEESLRAGHAALMAGKPAMDAVSAAISVLEDAPQFNAGRGAVFTHDGHNELDASVMDGASGLAGAVAGVRRVRHPIALARTVMDKSRHVMMVGEGAEAFATEQGIALVDPSWFRTDKRWNQLQQALKDEAAAEASAELPSKAYFGTVGALALDAQGHLAAGTSTGGMTNKRYGRVGDAPIIGAGTWADERCAVSGTGWGEYYIRTAAAHDICARMKYTGVGVRRASEAVINELIPGKGGDGGAIALASDGSVAFPFNTEGMYRGWIGADGVPHVAVFADEALLEP